MKKGNAKPKEKIRIKGWPPEVESENITPLGAITIIAVVLVVGLITLLIAVV